MTDQQYRTLTYHINEVHALIRPVAKETQLDEAPVRCRMAIATLATIMEAMIEAECQEDVLGRSLHLAYDLEPSDN